MNSEVYNELELNWREVTCKRSVQGNNFEQGIQDYDFSVSGKNAWIPAYTYFRAEIEITKLNGNISSIPLVEDNIALSDCVGNCLYNNTFFKAGGQSVSDIQQYIPQAAALKNRLDGSGAWLSHVGRDMTFCDSDFTRRRDKTALNGTYHEDGLIDRTVAGVVIPTDTGAGTFAYAAATKLITAVGLSYILTGVKPGDLIRFTNPAGMIVRVNRVVSATVLVCTPINFGDGGDVNSGAPDAGAVIIRQPDPRNGKNTRFVHFQPPIGIFDVHNGLGSGDFKFQLNPNSNYKRACLESLGNAGLVPGANASLAPGVDYDITIKNVFLYICLIKKDIKPSGITMMSLKEMQVLNKTFSNNGSLDFTVPPSTYAITVFVQGSTAGSDTRLPPTKFKTLNRGDENLKSIQVTYGSVSKPSTLYESEYTSSKNLMIQRWVQSQYHSKKLNNPGGCENFNNFMDRGAYYHFDFQRDKMDTSTYVNIQINYDSPLYTPPESPPYLFCVAHYTKSVKMEYENGYITQVVTANE